MNLLRFKKGIPGGAGFNVNPIPNFNGNVSSFEFEVNNYINSQ